MEWKHKPPPDWGSDFDVDTLRDTASLLGSSALPSSRPASSTWSSLAQQWGGTLRTLVLAAGAAASAAVAAAGLALLAYLLVTRVLTPAQGTFVRLLDLDYSSVDMVGRTAFLPEAQLSDGLIPPDLPPGSRFLAPGQAVDVWVDLTVTASSGSGMVQVVGELLTADGRLAGKASQPVLLRARRGWPLESLLATPLRWAGLLSDARTVRVRLFRAYREKEGAPFFIFSLALKCRGGSWAPEVLGAVVRVQLHMNPLRRLLYSLRPGSALTLLAGALALMWLLGGSALAVALLAALLYTATANGAGDEGGAGQEAASVGGVASEAASDEISSVSGVSDAGSELLRDSFDGDEGAQPPSPPSPRSAAAAAPAAAPAARGWGGLAAMGSGGAGRARLSLEGDDTPYLGSEAGSSRAQEQTLRLRRGGSGGALKL